jgi:hypothetical protein
MSDPVPAVTEAEATGETTAIYADIRRVYGVGVVNLVWRHLATFPGALPWAWETVRPLYADGTIRREAAAFRASRRLPEVAAPPPEVLAAAGFGPEDLLGIRDVLDAYERTNPMALVALSVAQHRLCGAATAGGGDEAEAVSGAPAAPEPEIRLPPLLRLDELAPPTARLVLRLNRIGAAGQDPVLASMYRNLAHWPGYLALAWALLAPLDANGRWRRRSRTPWRRHKRGRLTLPRARRRSGPSWRPSCARRSRAPSSASPATRSPGWWSSAASCAVPASAPERAASARVDAIGGDGPRRPRSRRGKPWRSRSTSTGPSAAPTPTSPYPGCRR